jgi:dihydrofolate reductase
MPFFIVTHRPEEEPEGGAFTFVAGVTEAVHRAVEAARGKDVHVMGGADVIRQALEAGLVDELTIIVAPVVLGGGKRLFEGFSQALDLEHLGVRQSQYGTFIDYRVKRP